MEGEADYDDAHTRVPHEEEVGAFTQAAEIGQPSAANEGERVVAASGPPSTVHDQHATDEFEAAQAPGEYASLAPALSADDISDDEMAPPRVTRPLPPDPPPAQAPPPPSIPKRISLPPPTRTVPVPLTDSLQRVQSYAPQRAPTAKRASLAPPPREIPRPAPDSPDVASLRPQPSTRRTSLPPPLIASPSPVPTPTRKPTVAPPVPDGRRIVESRRSTDSRSSHEERRGSGQYATLIAPATSGPVSPPSKKRVPSLLSLEQEVLDEHIAGALLS